MADLAALRDTKWDVVICGTSLEPALFALSLSRSGQKILHIDPLGQYGGPDAALSLKEAEAWAHRHSDQRSVPSPDSPFASAQFVRQVDHPDLGASRDYILPLAPQIIHTRSALLTQLVSSRAFLQLEFHSVGSFFVYTPSALLADPHADKPTAFAGAGLLRIPSTREDVFSSRDMANRPKRGLMKFLKFALEHELHAATWAPLADAPLETILISEFRLDSALCAAVVALTLSPDGRISVRDGLAAIRRHVHSIGSLGAGFAAVYPKWGGTSEISQVACRACAVGGGVYVLGVGAQSSSSRSPLERRVELTNGVTVSTRLLVQADAVGAGEMVMSRLILVVNSPLPSLFQPLAEGASAPAVAVVVFPTNTLLAHQGPGIPYPVYAMAHSSDTGECPKGQSVLFFSTLKTTTSTSLLENAAVAFLSVLTCPVNGQAAILCQLAYDQRCSAPGAQPKSNGSTHFQFPLPSAHLAFDDGRLDAVRTAWDLAQSNNTPDDDGHHHHQPVKAEDVAGDHHPIRVDAGGDHHPIKTEAGDHILYVKAEAGDDEHDDDDSNDDDDSDSESSFEEGYMTFRDREGAGDDDYDEDDEK